MKYFIAIANQQQGPFTLEQLRNQPLAPDTLVWKAGMGDWLRADQVPEINELMKTMSPPLAASSLPNTFPTEPPPIPAVPPAVSTELRLPAAGTGDAKKVAVNRRNALGLLAAGVVGMSAIYHFWPRRGGEVRHGSKQRAEKPEQTVEFPLPGGLKMAFCRIPPGTATLGRPVKPHDLVFDRDGKLVFNDEKEHSSTAKGFWLGMYPVTQGEWNALMGSNPSYFKANGDGAGKVKGLDTSRLPVECVSWDDCQQFVEKLNTVDGIEKAFGQAGRFALPHEDAWEYACRGGLGNQRDFYWGDELNGTQANINGNRPYGTSTQGPSLGRPTPVGNYATQFPHPWGLCDMHGNVWEWCDNLYEQTQSRVLRGGCWSSDGHTSRASYRSTATQGSHDRSDIGFRLLLPLAT